MSRRMRRSASAMVGDQVSSSQAILSDLDDNLMDDHPLVISLRRTGSLSTSLRRGVAYDGVSRLVVQLITLGSTVILARLLVPADYGVVALAGAVTGFAAIFADMGFAAAVVQARKVDDAMLATVFWLNATACAVVASLIAGSSWLFARLFDQPQVFGLMLVASVTMLFSVNVVNLGLMRRSLRFDVEGANSVVSTIVGIAVTVAAAFSGLGAYSLVIGPLASALTSLTYSFWRVRWWPTARPTKAAARDIWRYTRGITGFQIVNYWARNLDRVIIGRFVGIESLGFYNRSYNLMMLPMNQGVTVLGRVFFPVLSRMADQPERIRRAWLKLVRAAVLVGLPMGVGITLVSDPLVRTLFGERWLPMIPLLQLMSASIPFLVVGVNISPAYQALGRTGIQFRNGLITSAITIAFMLVGSIWGVYGVALAALIRCPITLSINAYPVLGMLGLKWREVLLPLWRTITCTAVMAAAVLLVHILSGDLPPWAVLLVDIAVGGVTYVVMAYLIERSLLQEVAGRRLSLRRRSSVGTPA